MHFLVGTQLLGSAQELFNMCCSQGSLEPLASIPFLWLGDVSNPTTTALQAGQPNPPLFFVSPEGPFGGKNQF